MQEYLIFTGTVTYAIKGRDVLRKNGIDAIVIKASDSQKNIGCSYAIVVKGNIKKAEELLALNGVRILKISKKY